MALRPLADVSPGDWFLDRRGYRIRASLGPSGFEAYVRVLHGNGSQPDEDDLSRIEGHLADPLLAALCDVPSRHTTTPEDCCFGLWDGYGAIQGGEAVSFLTTFTVAPLWPADHPWFVTSNIDSAWTGVGGSARLIADILADGRLEAVRTTYTDNQPEYL